MAAATPLPPAFLKVPAQDYLTRYVMAVLGIVIIAAIGYSWLAFVKR